MSNTIMLLIIALAVFVLVYLLIMNFDRHIYNKRSRTLDRLHGLGTPAVITDNDDIFARSFRERTLGYLSENVVNTVKQITPQGIQEKVDQRLKEAGNPRGIKAGDFIGALIIMGSTVFVLSSWLMIISGKSISYTAVMALCLTLLMISLPWTVLGMMATKRQQEIRRSLPELMDLLVINVEAGLAFDMALSKVTKRYNGAIAEEFQQAMFEMQLGKSRKDALQGVSKRVNAEELSTLVNAIIQSDQMGTALGQVLRVQADIVREKRRLWIEEQAMKAPVKLLFPLIFLIFPCMFIVILGPAIINISKNLLH